MIFETDQLSFASVAIVSIPDLAGTQTVQVTHVAEAVRYRRALKAAH